MRAIIASVTQGSADAFAELAFSTGLSNVTSQCFRIRRIEWFIPALISTDSEIMVQLSAKSQTAMALGTSNAVLAGMWKKVELTTSGSPVYELFPNATNYERDMDFLVVEETLYVDVDSTGTSLSNAVYLKLWVENRSITQNERLSIQAQRLS